MELNNQQLNALARRIVKEITEQSKSKTEEYAKSDQLQKDIDNNKLFQLVTKVFDSFEALECISVNSENDKKTYFRGSFRKAFEIQLVFEKQVKLPYDIFEVIKDSLILDNIDITNISSILDEYVKKYLNN